MLRTGQMSRLLAALSSHGSMLVQPKGSRRFQAVGSAVQRCVMPSK